MEVDSVVASFNFKCAMPMVKVMEISLSIKVWKFETSTAKICV